MVRLAGDREATDAGSSVKGSGSVSRSPTASIPAFAQSPHRQQGPRCCFDYSPARSRSPSDAVSAGDAAGAWWKELSQTGEEWSLRVAHCEGSAWRLRSLHRVVVGGRVAAGINTRSGRA
jgi:hypothetical protein